MNGRRRRWLVLACFVLAASALAAAGCTPSMIYSPSINLPPEPLKEKQVQVFGGVVQMPEARPNRAPEKTAKGMEFTARVGAADWLTLQAKFWKDISENFDAADRFGVSVSTIVAQTGDLGGFRVGLMPTATFLGAGDGWYGGGGTLPLCVWLPNLSVLHPYAAVGPGFGLHNTRDDEYGFLIVENWGCAALLAKHLTVNAEISLVNTFNYYDRRHDNFVTWSVNGGFLF
jgi:hypothetical protein